MKTEIKIQIETINGAIKCSLITEQTMEVQVLLNALEVGHSQYFSLFKKVPKSKRNGMTIEQMIEYLKINVTPKNPPKNAELFIK